MTPIPPSMIVFNADIVTMDAEHPAAEAIVCRRGKIEYIGSTEQALLFREADTVCIDAEKRVIIPGFNDNHLHALSMGNFFRFPLLFGKNPDEIIGLLKSFYKNARPGKTLMGFAWDYTDCPNPNKEVLDAAFPRNPVILRQYSGHAAWVNSCMLKKLKVSSIPQYDDTGLKVERNGNGHPTGIIRGTVVYKHRRNELLARVLNLPLHKKLLQTSLALLSEKGITSVQDNTWQPFSPWLLANLHHKGTLPVRFTCWPYGPYPLLAKSMDFCPWDMHWIRKGPWKYIVDGAFSPHTALLHEPYENEPGNTGISVMGTKELEKVLQTAAKKHRQLAFHAIGDKAVSSVIDAVEKTAGIYPQIKNMRIRLEHAQIIQKKDMPRIKAMGMCVAAQPTGLSQPQRDRAMFGDSRFPLLYPFKSLLTAGVALSFGSDFPGEIEYSPFTAIQAAVTRKGIHKNGHYDTAEAVSVMEAVRAYTTGSAYAEGTEKIKGMLKKGMLADFIVLSDNIFKTAPANIRTIETIMTVTGGRIVFSRL
ncbi:MAG: amidohydrolase [Spirochaetales bacterium]|nr:amidohydrolase [Spirochaetales bacterium]